MCFNNTEFVFLLLLLLFVGYRSGERRRPEGTRDKNKVSAGNDKLSEVFTLYLSRCN